MSRDRFYFQSFLKNVKIKKFETIISSLKKINESKRIKKLKNYKVVQ